MKKNFDRLDGSEVVSLSNASETIFVSHHTFKVSELAEALKLGFIGERGSNEEAAIKLFGEGIACEILAPYKNWQQGKVRITLEFCPDEPDAEAAMPASDILIDAKPPELSLEDIRRMRSENP